MNCSYDAEKNTLTAMLPERLTAINCDEEERALEEALEKAGAAGNKPCVFLDAARTRYMSSYGIRMLLRLARGGVELAVLNALPGLYEILTLSGLDHIISIFPPFQPLSLDGCQRVGGGKNGVVYRLDADKICKVFREEKRLIDILAEKRRSRQAFLLGLPTAISYQVVKVGNAYGLVYELLEAKTLSEALLEAPGREGALIRDYADFLVEINRTEAPMFPDKKAAFARGVLARLGGVLEPARLEALVRVLDAVPDGRGFVHGDPHFANLFITQGEMMVVDMDDTGRGDGLWDLAALHSTLMAFKLVMPLDVMRLGGMDRYDALWRGVLAAWAARRGADPAETGVRVAALSFSRVLDFSIRHGIDGEGRQQVLRRLCEALDGIRD